MLFTLPKAEIKPFKRQKIDFYRRVFFMRKLNPHRFLRFRRVKKRDHLYFNLLSYLYFRKSDWRSSLLITRPEQFTLITIIPYLLFNEIYLLRARRYFVILKGQIAGTIAIRERNETLYVSSLAVSPCCRRLKIGTHILDFTAEIGREMRKGWLELSVVKQNSPAYRLYRKYGFKIRQERRWSFIMRKEIE